MQPAATPGDQMRRKVAEVRSIVHQIQLNDQLFEVAQRRAAEAGFESGDEYVAEVLQGICGETENFDHLFTPERLAHIDQAAAQIDAGHGLTVEQVESELAKSRAKWLDQNKS